MRLLIRDTGEGMNCLVTFASSLPPVPIALHLRQVTQLYQYSHMGTDTRVPSPVWLQHSGSCSVLRKVNVLCPRGPQALLLCLFLLVGAKSKDQAEEQMSWGGLGSCIPADKHH